MAQNDEFCMFFRQPENVLFQSTPPALRWARMPTLQTESFSVVGWVFDPPK